LGDNAAKTANSVYVVYRALAGRREELEKSLAATAPGGSEAGTVLLQHLEGGPTKTSSDYGNCCRELPHLLTVTAFGF
jgi:hypothetical protein